MLNLLLIFEWSCKSCPECNSTVFVGQRLGDDDWGDDSTIKKNYMSSLLRIFQVKIDSCHICDPGKVVSLYLFSA